ncbi:hypothetical protein CLAIMM_06927 [Cladophialophora immunda]|nr:hypothetical protein CLAIMM_06927 [Cladophialophora immunda]
MSPVVFEFNEVPTQMGLKGTTIEGIVGISFMLGILAFFVILSFVRNIRIRGQSRVQGRLPANRRVRLDPVEGAANSIQRPPPAYDTLYADTGRPQSWPWSGLFRLGATASQERNGRDTPDLSDAAVEGNGDGFGASSIPPSSPTSVRSVLPPYCGRDPHGVPTYDTIACADGEARLRNVQSPVASQVLLRTPEDASSSLNTWESRTEIVGTEREISPSEP